MVSEKLNITNKWWHISLYMQPNDSPHIVKFLVQVGGVGDGRNMHRGDDGDLDGNRIGHHQPC